MTDEDVLAMLRLAEERYPGVHPAGLGVVEARTALIARENGISFEGWKQAEGLALESVTGTVPCSRPSVPIWTSLSVPPV